MRIKNFPVTDETLVILRGNLLEPGLNDAGNACRLLSLHGNDLCYCYGLKKWLCWDGRRWHPDSNGEAYRLGKAAMCAFLADALDEENKEKIRFAVESLNDRRIAHMLASAQCDKFIGADALDSHPMLLNALNGTIDLATGELRPHRREDFITKMVHVNYNPEATSPRWTRFLREILDANLIEYVQRALGYSLTGEVIEKAVFVPYGAGNNGKTTLLSTVSGLIPEYAVTLQAESLMSRPHSTNNITADLADLRGIRFANTSECEAGQRLSQSRLKAICQGMGKIKARKLYENPVEFAESHKLWLDTNSKPEIRDVDDQATFNRLHPIPFEKSFTKDEIDPELPDKLRTEAEGILAWLVEGARRWREERLGKPSEIEKATEDWRSENDNIGRFIEDCCVTGDGFSARAGQLYAAYRGWTEKSGEKVTAADREFSERLMKRGFVRKPDEKGRRYEGIGLKAEAN